MPSFWSKITSALSGGSSPASEIDPISEPDPEPASAPLPPDPVALRGALETLEGFFQNRVVPRMIAELRSPSVDVRRSAISVLRNAGLAGVHAIPALLEVVERPADPKDICTEYARKEAAYAIDELRRVYQRHLEEEQRRQQEIDAALRREEEMQRHEEEAAARAPSVEAEFEAQTPSQRVAPRATLDDNLAALVQLLTDPVPGVRVSVIQALVQLDAAHPEVLRALRNTARDEDPRVRQEAALAIGQLAR
jgi:HEAT repeat protein